VEVLEPEQIGDGSIGNEAFNAVTLQKVQLILQAVDEQWGGWFIYSDVDVQFIRPVGRLAQQCLKTDDICFQRDSPTGELCTGFFAARANESVRRLWRDVEHHLSRDLSQHDQTWLNELLDPLKFLEDHACPRPALYLWIMLRRLRLLLGTYSFCKIECWARLKIQSSYGVRIGLFPNYVFGAGTDTGSAWNPHFPFKVPRDACVHHANYAAGIAAKLEQLHWVRSHYPHISTSAGLANRP